MNLGEFNVWIKRHQSLFPKLTEWLGNHPEPRVILDAWATALRSCRADHARDATSRMLRGIAPLVESNDWSTLPAVVIAHCRPLGSGKAPPRHAFGRLCPGGRVAGSSLAPAPQKNRRRAASSRQTQGRVPGPRVGNGRAAQPRVLRGYRPGRWHRGRVR